MKYISETLAKVGNAKTKNDKIKILREEGDELLRIFISFVYHPSVKTWFSEIPQYKPLKGPVDSGMINMRDAMKKLYLFQVDHPAASPNLTQKKRETILIQTLEALSADDAEVFAMMVTKKQPKELNRGLIKEALGMDFVQ